MKAAMMRKVDDLGRIVLPKELRKSQGLSTGTPMDILLDDEGNVLLRRSVSYCILCGSPDVAMWTEKKRALCAECIEKIKKG